MLERPPNQGQRETIYFWLRELEAAQVQYTHLISPYEFTRWIHFTDFSMLPNDASVGLNFQVLVEEGILQPVKVPYQPQGDWRDRFAPLAYVLTEKGRAILQNPRDWVFRGEAKIE